MNECRRFLVYGKVQGVWFRESTRRQAQALNLTGQAVNLADGSVEVIACGERQAIQRLEDWLHKGPLLAKVQRVEQVPCEMSAATEFTVG